jgi:hypothetical protein
MHIDHFNNERFMENLKPLCGEELKGEYFSPNLSDPEPMIFSFYQCSEHEMRIMAVLSETEQFTIVLTMVGNDLLLKHDTRDSLLAPGDNVMFGGFANEGDEFHRVFPVHNFGAGMWSDYEGFAWQISLNKEQNIFEYIELSHDDVNKHLIAKLPS